MAEAMLQPPRAVRPTDGLMIKGSHQLQPCVTFIVLPCQISLPETAGKHESARLGDPFQARGLANLVLSPTLQQFPRQPRHCLNKLS
jgi:hypothetical protein